MIRIVRLNLVPQVSPVKQATHIIAQRRTQELVRIRNQWPSFTFIPSSSSSSSISSSKASAAGSPAPANSLPASARPSAWSFDRALARRADSFSRCFLITSSLAFLFASSSLTESTKLLRVFNALWTDCSKLDINLSYSCNPFFVGASSWWARPLLRGLNDIRSLEWSMSWTMLRDSGSDGWLGSTTAGAMLTSFSKRCFRTCSNLREAVWGNINIWSLDSGLSMWCLSRKGQRIINQKHVKGYRITEPWNSSVPSTPSARLIAPEICALKSRTVSFQRRDEKRAFRWIMMFSSSESPEPPRFRLTPLLSAAPWLDAVAFRFRFRLRLAVGLLRTGRERGHFMRLTRPRRQFNRSEDRILDAKHRIYDWNKANHHHWIQNLMRARLLWRILVATKLLLESWMFISTSNLTLSKPHRRGKA